MYEKVGISLPDKEEHSYYIVFLHEVTQVTVKIHCFTVPADCLTWLGL